MKAIAALKNLNHYLLKGYRQHNILTFSFKEQSEVAKFTYSIGRYKLRQLCIKRVDGRQDILFFIY